VILLGIVLGIYLIILVVSISLGREDG